MLFWVLTCVFSEPNFCFHKVLAVFCPSDIDFHFVSEALAQPCVSLGDVSTEWDWLREGLATVIALEDFLRDFCRLRGLRSFPDCLSCLSWFLDFGRSSFCCLRFFFCLIRRLIRVSGKGVDLTSAFWDLDWARLSCHGWTFRWIVAFSADKLRFLNTLRFVLACEHVRWLERVSVIFNCFNFNQFCVYVILVLILVRYLSDADI